MHKPLLCQTELTATPKQPSQPVEMLWKAFGQLPFSGAQSWEKRSFIPHGKNRKAQYAQSLHRPTHNLGVHASTPINSATARFSTVSTWLTKTTYLNKKRKD